MKFNRVLFLLVTACWLSLSVAAQAQVTNMSTVAKPGDKNPQGEVFNSVNQASINAKGDVAFLGTTTTSAIYIKEDVLNDGALRTVLSTAVTPPVGGRFGTFTFPKINDNGDVAFSSIITGSSSTGGLFLVANSGEVRTIALDNDPTPAGGTFAPFLSRSSIFTLNNRAEVVFIAPIQNGSGSSGVFLVSNGQLTKVVVNGEPAPGGGTFMLTQDTLPFINNNGDVSFTANITGSTSGNGSAVFIFSQGTIRRIVGVGDAVPQGTFQDVESRGRFLNDKGELAFLGRANNQIALYMATVTADNVTITRVLGVGDAAPDGGTFKDLTLSLTPSNSGLNNNSHLLFRADTTKTVDGLFIFTGDKVQKIVGKLEPSPIGGIFPIDASFTSAYLGAILSDSDLVVFESKILNGLSSKAIILWTRQARSAPVITAVAFAKKTLTVNASAVSAQATVEINGRVITQPITTIGGDKFTIKGNRKKLNLKPGEGNNQIVITINGLRSQPFTF